MYKGGAVALVIKKSLNGSFLFSIFCIKLAVILMHYYHLSLIQYNSINEFLS